MAAVIKSLDPATDLPSLEEELPLFPDYDSYPESMTFKADTMLFDIRARDVIARVDAKGVDGLPFQVTVHPQLAERDPQLERLYFDVKVQGHYAEIALFVVMKVGDELYRYEQARDYGLTLHDAVSLLTFFMNKGVEITVQKVEKWKDEAVQESKRSHYKVVYKRTRAVPIQGKFEEGCASSIYDGFCARLDPYEKIELDDYDESDSSDSDCDE